MNIQQLKCFVKVSKTLNFTKASQNLFISQTAVSNHIKHLEETLGFHLFIRNKKHVQLTQQGKIFLKSALKVLEANQECYQTIQYLHHENFGQLRIGYLKGIEHCIMIKNIQNFYQVHATISRPGQTDCYTGDSKSPVWPTVRRGCPARQSSHPA